MSLHLRNSLEKRLLLPWDTAHRTLIFHFRSTFEDFEQLSGLRSNFPSFSPIFLIFPFSVQLLLLKMLSLAQFSDNFTLDSNNFSILNIKTSFILQSTGRTKSNKFGWSSMRVQANLDKNTKISH